MARLNIPEDFNSQVILLNNIIAQNTSLGADSPLETGETSVIGGNITNVDTVDIHLYKENNYRNTKHHSCGRAVWSCERL